MPTMKNSVMASSSLGITKQKPMKRRKNSKHSRKKLKLNKVASYLISDPYLYTPLVSPQPTFDHFPSPKHIFTPPAGDQEDVALPVKKTKGKNFMEKVIEFLQADCFMYSPLVTKSHAVDTSSVSGHSQTTKVNGRAEAHGNGSMEVQGGRIQHLTQEGRDVSSRSLGARPVVMKTVSYRESVKHVVQPDDRTKSNQGV